MRLRRPTFEALSEEWLAELEHEGKSGETLRAYRNDLRLWNESGLDPHSYLLSLTAHGAKPSTVNRRRAALRAYHSWLLERREISSNPLERSKMVKNPRRLRRTLTVAEVARLVDAAGTSLGRERTRDQREELGHRPLEWYRARLAAMIALQVTSGLRVGELCNARLEFVDLDRRRIRVIRKGDKELQLRFGLVAKRRLQEWLDKREVDSEWLFPAGVGGNAISPRSYTRQLQEVCYWADLDPINPHLLRHTFATHAIESGIPVADLQQMLGHEQISTTMLYVNRHPDRGWDRYAAHALEGEFEPGAQPPEE